MTVRHNSDGDDERVEQRHIERGQILTLGTVDKLVAIILAIGTVVFSVGGNYMLTNYRLTEQEKLSEKNDSRITQLETYGHPDHERRITKLETRADLADNSINEINRKLDTAIAILNRVDKQTNNNERGGEVAKP